MWLMKLKTITAKLTASSQITPADLDAIAARGFAAVIDNRPDGEEEGQPTSAELAAAAQPHGIAFHYLPIKPGQVTPEAAQSFGAIVTAAPGPVLAFCRSGSRSEALWTAYAADRQATEAGATPGRGSESGRSAVARAPGSAQSRNGSGRDRIVIVGGGSAGIAVAASLLRRRADRDIVIVEPGEVHSYQPGWTLVGAGVFRRAQTQRPMASVMPKRVRWVKAAAAGFAPERNAIVLEDGSRLDYQVLIAAPGIMLDWDAIPGLKDTLGQNGVTSNYRADLAPYTWELVQELKQGRALFTQPAMPIKCAGAPQKALYLSCDHWWRQDRLGGIEPEFHTVTPSLFGVAYYVPALMEYIHKYQVGLNLESRLVTVDGPARVATFEAKGADGSTRTFVKNFDMLHVCPPQKAPAFVAGSVLANAAGWIDVDPQTLRHVKFDNVFALGDVASTSNAKTAAAARKQAPVVAENVLSFLAHREPRAIYDGYGSCPLMVERGKVVLAEFGYGGKLLPTFPPFIIDGSKPSRLAWILKKDLLPFIYWNGMLKGREWLAKPAHRAAVHASSEPAASELAPAGIG
jgi:sulfide:quinone oxidoreductase